MRTLQSIPGRPSVLWLSEKPKHPSQESSCVPILVKTVLSSGLQGADRNSFPRQAASNTSLCVQCLTPSPKQADNLRRHLLRYQFPPSNHCFFSSQQVHKFCCSFISKDLSTYFGVVSYGNNRMEKMAQAVLPWSLGSAG